MKTRRSFRPSELGLLEDRVVPSHAAAEIASLAIHAQRSIATFHGKYTTKVQHGVDTASATISLPGTATIPNVGTVKISGTLANHIVLPSHGFNTQGILTLTAKKHPGRLTVAVTGPYANLAPTAPETIHLTFTVQSSIGSLATTIGAQGTADLTLNPVGKTTGKPGMTNTSHGNFTLVASVG